MAHAANHGTLQFIAMGIPPDEDGSSDLQYVLAAARSIGRHMTNHKVFIDKRPVPVCIADKVCAAIEGELLRRNVLVNFTVCSNPITLPTPCWSPASAS